MLAIEPYASQEIIELLQNNVIGTPGESMLYQLKTTPQKLKSIGKHYFVSLKRKDNVIGTACLCQREINITGKAKPAFYIRYFTFNEKYRRKGGENSQWQPKGRIKEEIYRLLEGQHIMDSNDAIFYAYVDPKNERSARICKGFGFQTVSSFVTYVFSRLFPKLSPQVSKLPFQDVIKFPEFRAYYNSLDFFFPEYISEFYIIQQEGELIACAHARKDNWKILSLPGKSGKLLLTVLPKIPLLNRLFSKDYHFIGLDATFCKTGHEKALETLISHILADLNMHSALIPVATEGKLNQQLKKTKLGLLAKFSKNKQISLIAKNLSNSSRKPDFFISSFDIT